MGLLFLSAHPMLLCWQQLRSDGPRFAVGAGRDVSTHPSIAIWNNFRLVSHNEVSEAFITTYAFVFIFSWGLCGGGACRPKCTIDIQHRIIWISLLNYFCLAYFIAAVCTVGWSMSREMHAIKYRVCINLEVVNYWDHPLTPLLVEWAINSHLSPTK